MPKPTPGVPYVIVHGDNLSHIALKAYGRASKWKDIWKANSGTLRSGNPNLIFPGEVLRIPSDDIAMPDEETGADVLPDKGPNEFTLLIDGEEVNVEQGSCVTSIDSVADGWAAQTAWNPNNMKHVRLFQPFSYKSASAYLGGQLIVSGRIYGVAPQLDPQKSTIQLSGWSPAADIIDSVCTPPYEVKNKTLKQRAETLLKPFGLDVYFDSSIDDKPFKRITAEKEETVFEHLKKLAQQRGALLTTLPDNVVGFVRAASGKPVAVIEEGKPPFCGGSISLDGRARFSTYTVISQTPGRKGRKGKRKEQRATATDANVPATRFMTFKADDDDSSTPQDTAEWRMQKTLAECVSLQLKVNSWYDKTGNLWAKNTIISVKSKTLFIPDGFEFLIKAIEFTLDGDEGGTAVLTLVPPFAFSGPGTTANYVDPWRGDA
jgi:prophage tail gpP-like protein/LysM repeat protein